MAEAKRVALEEVSQVRYTALHPCRSVRALGLKETRKAVFGANQG